MVPHPAVSGAGGVPVACPVANILRAFCARTAEFFETTAARAHSSSRAQARPFQL